MKARSIHTRPWYLVLIGGVLCLSLAVPVVRAVWQATPPQLSDSPYLRIDPEKIVTSDGDSSVPCGECHTLEYEVWKETPHATGFDLLHRTENAQEILEKMDFRLSKRESLCLRCHYTATLKNDQARAIAGVSCESCHGAARDWVNVHNDYGGADHDTEPDAHRQQRIAQSIEGGMLRPSDDLYAVAANCFECHTVPNEKLVNVGGHRSGSSFDLIEWSDKIRHNFVQAQWSSDETNRAKTPERKRLMFVIGQVLGYEYSLRAAAEATETGTFFKAIERKVKRARRDLEKLYRAAPLPVIQTILTQARDVNVAPSNKTALLATADAISTAAREFAQNNDGSQLAALDPLIAGEPVAADEPDVDEAPPTDPGTVETTPPPNGATTPGTATTTTDSTATPPAAGPPVQPTTPAVAVAGQISRRPAWFTGSKYATLGPADCGECHNDEIEWWDRDKHAQSASPLLRHDPKAVQIAQTYGLSVSQMKRGNQICMNCHGTIVTGDEGEEVFDGVSCESCHGPGSKYVRQHQPPKTNPPPDWSGYAKAASLGMINQENPTTRVENCVRCHHITDERLISSGHPTGEDFNMGERNQAIKHWDDPILGAGTLNSAYQQARQRRPVPQVQIATPVVAAVPPPPVTQRRRSSSGSRAASQGPVRPPVPRTRPVSGSARGPDGPALTLQPPPMVSDSTSTEEILLLVKKRLDDLYRALGRGQ